MVKNFYVIGDQASKSLSPLIFTHWFKKYNIQAKYSYLEVDRKNFDSKIIEILTDKKIFIKASTPFKRPHERRHP